MTTVDARAAEVADYLAGVRAALADLPPAQLEALLEDLPEHIAEVAASDPQPLADRLGSPVSFAAETRSAAGLPAAPPPPPSSPSTVASSTAEHVRALAVAANAGLGRLLGYERATLAGPPLRPGWWLARGLLGAGWLLFLAGAISPGALSYAASPGFFAAWLIDPLALLAGAVASTRLGRVSLTNPVARALGWVVDAFVAVAIIDILWILRAAW
jgi:hypothetical protein